MVNELTKKVTVRYLKRSKKLNKCHRKIDHYLSNYLMLILIHQYKICKPASSKRFCKHEKQKECMHVKVLGSRKVFLHIKQTKKAHNKSSL